jgi:3-oxoacyl-[acyl-carrier-protein] synthase-3
VPALDVRNQCSGFLYSLSVADAWIRAACTRTCSWSAPRCTRPGIEFNERGRDVAVLFGDGAGAVLVGEATRPEQGVRSLELHADGSGAYDLWLEAPASKFPRG